MTTSAGAEVGSASIRMARALSAAEVPVVTPWRGVPGELRGSPPRRWPAASRRRVWRGGDPRWTLSRRTSSREIGALVWGYPCSISPLAAPLGEPLADVASDYIA